LWVTIHDMAPNGTLRGTNQSALSTQAGQSSAVSCPRNQKKPNQIVAGVRGDIRGNSPCRRTTRSSVSLLMGTMGRAAMLAAGRPPSASPGCCTMVSSRAVRCAHSASSLNRSAKIRRLHRLRGNKIDGPRQRAALFAHQQADPPSGDGSDYEHEKTPRRRSGKSRAQPPREP